MTEELFSHDQVVGLAPGYFDEIAARCEAASPGPWIHETGNFSGRNWLLATIQLGNSTLDGEDHHIHITTDNVHASELYGDAKLDAEFIVHARNDVVNLLTAYRSERARREVAEARVQELENDVLDLENALGNAH